MTFKKEKFESLDLKAKGVALLYCNLYQIITDKSGKCRGIFRDSVDPATEIDVVIRRNSNGEISYITAEFPGFKAQFHISILFDGTGDSGAGLDSIAIPKITPAANRLQKALAFLSFIRYALEFEGLSSNLRYFQHRIVAEYENGDPAIMELYNAINQRSMEFLKTGSAATQAPDISDRREYKKSKRNFDQAR